MNNKFVVVLVTASSLAEAKKIGQGLVEKKLAACTNIVPDITSLFSWEGKFCEEKEVLLLIKSKEELLTEVINHVKQNHSYKVPEIIALPIIAGSKDYLDWLGDGCLKKEDI